jgi:hypothetical protein
MQRRNSGGAPREREKDRREKEDVISELTLNLFF